jgi:hypothetical protein
MPGIPSGIAIVGSPLATSASGARSVAIPADKRDQWRYPAIATHLSNEDRPEGADLQALLKPGTRLELVTPSLPFAVGR